MSKIKRALVSVSDKTGVVELARQLTEEFGIEIISTGGTLKTLRDAGIQARSVQDITHVREVMGGRVKTLHPAIAGGILFRRSNESDAADLIEIDGVEIDLVVVNLYQFKKKLAQPNVTEAELIEEIDIGGPTLIREGAKNFESVTVITSPTDYAALIKQLTENDGSTRLEFRRRCAEKVFALTVTYDLDILRWLSGGRYDGMIGELVRKHRYGENPQQLVSGLYSCHTGDPLGLGNFIRVDGADPGYVNDTDMDRLLTSMTHVVATFAQNGRPFKYYAIGVKHGNACGASFGNNKLTVLRNMVRGNPRAIWGGMVMTNFIIGEKEAQVLRRSMAGKRKRILDGVFAPKITPEAIEILKRPKGACKMLINPELENPTLNIAPIFRQVRDGFLKQQNYSTYIFRFDRPSVKRIGKLSRAQKDNMLLAAAICQTSNSNTATLVKNRILIGNGTTRPDRVDANELAVRTAEAQGHNVTGAVGADDSFFPYPDGAMALIDAGVTAILTVSGSVTKGGGDEALLKVIKENGTSLVWLPVEEGRMFFGH